MTDEELVKRLRDPDEMTCADGMEAADRIEAIEQHVADLLVDLPCGCGYDNPTDVCMKHLPLVRKLTEQLEAARADAKEAEAYAEELARDLVKADNDIDGLKIKVAKAVEALQAFKAFDDMPARDKRPDVFEVSVRRKLLSTLAEIEGEKT